MLGALPRFRGRSVAPDLLLRPKPLSFLMSICAMLCIEWLIAKFSAAVSAKSALRPPPRLIGSPSARVLLVGGPSGAYVGPRLDQPPGLDGGWLRSWGPAGCPLRRPPQAFWECWSLGFGGVIADGSPWRWRCGAPSRRVRWDGGWPGWAWAEQCPAACCSPPPLLTCRTSLGRRVVVVARLSSPRRTLMGVVGASAGALLLILSNWSVLLIKGTLIGPRRLS